MKLDERSMWWRENKLDQLIVKEQEGVWDK